MTFLQKQQAEKVNWLIGRMNSPFSHASINHKWCDTTYVETTDFLFFYLGGHEL